MEKILCATDYSENSISALKYAYEVSKKLNASLLIIHVFEYPILLGTEIEESYQYLHENTFKQQELKLKEFCIHHLGDNLEEMNVSLVVIEDEFVVDAIVSKAEEIKAFLIIVGMKGTSVLKKFIMGSTTRHLIDKAPCLVLAIPEQMSYRKINTIVYATDFEYEADIEVIRKLSGIAKAFDAKIKVVHITAPKEYSGEIQMSWFKEMLKNKVDYKKVEFKVLFSEDIFETLRVYLDSINADVVVMLEREKRGFLNKLFHQDLVKKMDAYGKTPLISFNEDNFGMFHFLEF